MLQLQLVKLAALLVGIDCYGTYGYINTHVNPADLPSRIQWGGLTRRQAFALADKGQTLKQVLHPATRRAVAKARAARRLQTLRDLSITATTRRRYLKESNKFLERHLNHRLQCRD